MHMPNSTRSTVINHIVSQPKCLVVIYSLPQAACRHTLSCKEGAQVALKHEHVILQDLVQCLCSTHTLIPWSMLPV